MDRPGGRIDRLQHRRIRLGIDIEQQQIGGADAREMHPARIEQECPSIRRDGGTQMIRHRLMPVEPGDQAKGGGEFDAQRRFVGRNAAGGRGQRVHRISTCWFMIA
jgi:hypothetical protein